MHITDSSGMDREVYGKWEAVVRGGAVVRWRSGVMTAASSSLRNDTFCQQRVRSAKRRRHVTSLAHKTASAESRSSWWPAIHLIAIATVILKSRSSQPPGRHPSICKHPLAKLVDHDFRASKHNYRGGGNVEHGNSNTCRRRPAISYLYSTEYRRTAPHPREG